MKPFFQVKFQDGSVFEVPTIIVAQDRAAYYHERDTDEFPTLDDALKDTTELFASDTYEIEDWAKNNMNWDELAPHARFVSYEPAERNWMNCELSFHDERTSLTVPADGDNIMSQPTEFALARMAADGNICNALKISNGAPDGPIVAALVMIQGGPQVVDFFMGGLSRLTERFAETVKAVSESSPTTQPEQQ